MVRRQETRTKEREHSEGEEVAEEDAVKWLANAQAVQPRND